MAVAVHRPNFRPDHPVRAVSHLVDMRRDDRLGETRPAGTRVELVGRREKRFARDDIDVNARLLVVVIFTRERTLGAVFLGNATLFRGEAAYRPPGLLLIHFFISYSL